MGFIEWVPALDIGIAEIDAQHRALVGLINRLDEARARGAAREELAAALGGLRDYAAAHFALEEGLFAERGYPGAKEHVAEHRAFSAKVEAFAAAFAAGKAAVDGEILGFLKTWLTTHISFSDRKYRRHLAR